MTRTERLRYELFERVREFGTAHRDRFAESSTAGKAFAAVAAAATEVHGQLTESALAVAEGRKAKVAIRATIDNRLADITRAARMLARHQPGAEGMFKRPRAKTDVARLATARAFISQREVAMQQFGHLGMPVSMFAELELLVEQFEHLVEQDRGNRRGRTALRATIAQATRHGFDAVKVLDVAVPFTLDGDPALLATWKQARRLATGGRPVAAAETPPAETTPEAAAGSAEPLPTAS